MRSKFKQPHDLLLPEVNEFAETTLIVPFSQLHLHSHITFGLPPLVYSFSTRLRTVHLPKICPVKSLNLGIYSPFKGSYLPLDNIVVIVIFLKRKFWLFFNRCKLTSHNCNVISGKHGFLRTIRVTIDKSSNNKVLNLITVNRFA